MASPLSSTPRRAGDEWTMVDRFSELLENGAMSDISLPPLPPFGVSPSEAGSSSSSSSSSESDNDVDDDHGDDLGEDGEGSSGEEESWEHGQEEEQRRRLQQLYFSRPENGDRDTTDGGESAGRQAVVSPGTARPVAGTGRRRRSAVTGGGSGSNGRRRAAGRAGREATLLRGSSRSVSPARPRRRGGGRTERNGRRADEGPPALQSASEPSDASTSFTSSEESSDEPHRRQVLPGFCGGVPGAGPRAGSSEGGDGGGGRGGVSELVPFSLSEIACVPSETVSEITGSAASSPFRIHGGTNGGSGGDGALRSKQFPSSSSRRSSGSSPGSGKASAAAAAAAAAAATAAAAGGESAAAAAATPTAATQVVEADTGEDHCRATTYHLTPRAAARRRTNSSASSGSSLGIGAGVPAAGEMEDGDAHPGNDVPRKNTPLMLAFGLRDISDDNDSNSNDANGARYDAGEECKEAGSPATGTAGRSCASASDSPAVSVSGSGCSGGAWSSSVSSARGMTPSSLVPLGPLLDWEGGGNTAGAGGGGGTFMSASLAGFAGYRSALLEARRAAVAEDQVEFWQRRACAAEKVVKEQNSKIMELRQRCASLSTEASAARAGAGPKPSPAAVTVPSKVAVEHQGEEKQQQQQQQQQQRHQRKGGAGRIGAVEDEVSEARCDQAVTAAAAGKKGKEGIEAALTAIGGIAFTGFSVGQVSMFFPTPEGNFLAFNVGCPGHFLSKESQALVGKDDHFRPYYVLGRIIEIQDEVCEEKNPYGLPIGQRIKVVFVESITPDLRAAGVIPSN